MKKLTSGLFAAALALALPMTANAQEAVTPQADQEQCVAQTGPIQTGEKVAATSTFDTPFGKIVELQAPAESNLSLHTEVEAERTEMGREDVGAEGDVEVGAEADVAVGAEDAQRDPMLAENQSTFWLVADNVEPGTYEVTLQNEAGETCTTEITVEKKAEAGVGADAAIDVEIEEEDVEETDTEDSDW